MPKKCLIGILVSVMPTALFPRKMDSEGNRKPVNFHLESPSTRWKVYIRVLIPSDFKNANILYLKLPYPAIFLRGTFKLEKEQTCIAWSKAPNE